jgi:hypothetical protein
VAPTTGLCGIGPYVIPADGTPTTDVTVGTRVEDGKSGASVECKVKKSGGGFNLSGSIKQGDSFFVSGHVDQTGEGTYSGSGSVSFYASSWGSVSSSTCTFTVSATQEIGDGRVWATAFCTNSRAGNEPGNSCEYSASFILENCES